jgi:hypothetical protein
MLRGARARRLQAGGCRACLEAVRDDAVQLRAVAAVVWTVLYVRLSHRCGERWFSFGGRTLVIRYLYLLIPRYAYLA